VAVKIKLKRLGKIRAPYYRIVVADARTKRDGRAIEEIGKYHPKAEPSFIEVNSERAQHWLSVGAQPTDPVRKIFEITGDWQKFKGLPGAEGTLKTAAPKENRKEIFAAAVKETLGDDVTPPKSRGRSAAAAKEGDAPAQKGGKAAKSDPAKSERPAKARSGEQSAKARHAETAGDSKAEGADASDTSAKDTAAKDTAAKDTAAKDTAARSAGAKDSAVKAPAQDPAAAPESAHAGPANGD